MRTQVFVCFLTTLSWARAGAQARPAILAPLNQFSVGAEYSNDSSHIILGEAFNRRLAGLDLTYSRRVGRTRGVIYDWYIEVRPVTFLQDPTEAVDVTTSFSNQPTPSHSVLPAFPIQRRCRSGETTYSFPGGIGPGGTPIIVTFDDITICGARWTYAGGLSPVGQRVSFLPTHRLQPYLLANGGFLVSTRDVPVVDSSRFNFTFTFGAGLTWFAHGETSWSFDYRVQHLSNKKIGDNNPGVDSQVFRVSYTVPRLHLHHRS